MSLLYNVTTYTLYEKLLICVQFFYDSLSGSRILRFVCASFFSLIHPSLLVPSRSFFRRFVFSFLSSSHTYPAPLIKTLRQPVINIYVCVIIAETSYDVSPLSLGIREIQTISFWISSKAKLTNAVTCSLQHPTYHYL